MNDYMRQAEEMFRNGTKGMQGAMPMTPEAVKAMAVDGLTKTRETCERMTAVAVDAGKAMEKVTGVANQSVHAMGEKVMTNMVANTQAVFDTAEAVVRAKSLPEAAQLQADFMRTQMEKASEQTREFFELSNQMFRSTFEQFTSAAKGFAPAQAFQADVVEPVRPAAKARRS
jgi:hypothetical protein